MTDFSSPNFRFDAKDPILFTDPLRGFPALHDTARVLLDFLCSTAEVQHMPKLVVTCFGRLKDDQEAIYFQTELQRIYQTIVGSAADKMARVSARNRFSWHCIDKADGKCRAIDLRDWTLTAPQRGFLIEAARRQFPTAELLDHQVVGGGRHFHAAIPGPRRPLEWY